MYCEVREIPKFISSSNFKIIVILGYIYSKNISQVEIVSERFNKKWRSIKIKYTEKLKSNKFEEFCCSSLQKIRSSLLANNLYVKTHKIIIYLFFDGCESRYFCLV